MEKNRSTTILGSVFGLFFNTVYTGTNFIKAPFSYLYNKLNHYNYTIQGTFNRAKKNNDYFSPESLRAIDQYLKKGFNPDFTLEDGTTPFYYLTDKLDKRPGQWNDSDNQMTQKLIKYNANINFALENGKTPLIVTTQAQNLSLVKSLLNSNAQVNTCEPILNMAIRAGNNELVKLLLEYNANVDQRDMRCDSRAPLAWAAEHKNLEAIKMLCNAGASLVVDPRYNATIFHLLEDMPEEYYITIMTHARFADGQYTVHTNCKNTILREVERRIRGLKKILQMQYNIPRRTALERLLFLHETYHKYDQPFITRMTELLNGTKLDADFKKLKAALTEISTSEQTKKSNPLNLIPLLEKKLDQNNLALEMYKNVLHSLLPSSISIYSS